MSHLRNTHTPWGACDFQEMKHLEATACGELGCAFRGDETPSEDGVRRDRMWLPGGDGTSRGEAIHLEEMACAAGGDHGDLQEGVGGLPVGLVAGLLVEVGVAEHKLACMRPMCFYMMLHSMA
jgi:hypothetical protein